VTVLNIGRIAPVGYAAAITVGALLESRGPVLGGAAVA
jgi:hypothetical protein